MHQISERQAMKKCYLQIFICQGFTRKSYYVYFVIFIEKQCSVRKDQHVYKLNFVI